ncbi:hypothetical protein CKM354_001232200 [Cercospora kikuchii]|uniref:Uncharacterized protein n=1 Tax=Cercospora kikuchii TaxID=84275 RepID=A0A9P3FLT9_9PEZI|nr:uncharacterized protein CKM354_001232200 [Cercospora kikuchii]GIZ49290.1 hypothetical protein CKM354_001232200 [Cercospora kikuchii]
MTAECFITSISDAFLQEPLSDSVSTPTDEVDIKQEENQQARLSPSPPIDLKKASRETLRKLACEGSLEASELLSERRANDRAGYEKRKVHLANGRASTLASYERQRENGKRRRERKKREAEKRAGASGVSEDVAEESMESSKTQEALPEDMSKGLLEKDEEVSAEVEDTEMREVEEKVAKIDEQRWDREICWSIYEALGW